MPTMAGQALLQHIHNNDCAAVANFLTASNCNLDERDDNGQTFLMLASQLGSEEIVRELLSAHDVDVASVDNDNWTALLNASKEGHTEVVILLCEHGATIEHQDMGGWTALMWACYKGRTDVALELLERGANPNVKGEHFMSSLIWAAGRGHTAIVEGLLVQGAKVNTTDKYGSTALIWACRRGHRDVVDMLLAEGANVDNAGMYSWTALIVASKGGYTEVVDALLECHPNANAVDKDGYSALTWAAHDGHVDIANLLLHNGAYANLPDREGDSILIHATKGGHHDVTKVLLKKYADIDVLGFDQKSALYWAVEKNHYSIVKLLLAQEANTELACKDGGTPLLKAVRCRNLDLVRLLMDKGAKVSAADKRGDTALHVCVRSQSKRITEQLLRNPKDGRLLYKPNKNGETPYQIDMSHQKSILSQVFGGRNLNDDESMKGYELYSSTLADMLSDPSLHTPITLGLYAKWGSGKSFLIDKLTKEMNAFTKHNVEPGFVFSWLEFLICIFVSGITGLVLGLSLRWEIGVGVGGAIFLLQYVILGLVYHGANHKQWGWADRLSNYLGGELQLLKLLLKVIFCNEPPPPSREQVAVRFLFTNNARMASVVGEKSITAMIATLCESMEHKYGTAVTRLYRLFQPVKADSQKRRFKTICCIPYFVFVLFVVLCIIAAAPLIVIAKLHRPDLADPPYTPVHISLIIIAIIVGGTLLGNIYVWLRMVVSLVVPAATRVHRIGAALDSHKMESYVAGLKHEVELLGRMTVCMDAFLGMHTRLCVIVDGLDSCDQGRLLQVLDTVHTLFGDDRPFITIFAIDPQVVIKGIEHSLQGLFRDSSITGHDYLRNIVQLPFYLQSRALPKQALPAASVVRHESNNVVHESSSRMSRRERNDANDSGSRRRQRPTFRSSNVSLSAKATAAQTSQTNLAKTLGKSTYFSDANPRNMRRLMNIIAVTGRLLRAFNIEFSWYKLAAWVNITEQWPYRISWLIMEIEDSHNLDENTDLNTLYRRIQVKMPVSKDVDPLLEIDRNAQKLEIFLSSHQPALKVADVHAFLPCTINIDPYLRKLIRDLQANMETATFAMGMSMQKNMSVGVEAAGWPYRRPSNISPRSTPMKHVYWGSNGGVGKPYPQPSGSPMNLYQGGQAAAFNNPNFNTPNYSVSQLSMQHMMVPQPMGPQPMGPQPMGPQPMGPQPMGPQPMGPQPMGPQPMGPPISPQLSALMEERGARLTEMSVPAVSAMLRRLPGLLPSSLVSYCERLEQHNVSGAVLASCDLAELRPLMRMTFGDWALFRARVELLREGEALAGLRDVRRDRTETSSEVSVEMLPEFSGKPAGGSGEEEGEEEVVQRMGASIRKQDSVRGLVLMESHALSEALASVGLDSDDTSERGGGSPGEGRPGDAITPGRDDDDDDDESEMEQAMRASHNSIPRAVFTIDSSRLGAASGSEDDTASLISLHSSDEHVALRKLARSADTTSTSAFKVVTPVTTPKARHSPNTHGGAARTAGTGGTPHEVVIEMNAIKTTSDTSRDKSPRPDK